MSTYAWFLGVPHEGMSDAQLAELARRDPRAFDLIVRRHAPALHRLAAGLVGPGSADDAVQEALIAAHRGLRGFRGEAELTSWLHRITVNACQRLLRARRELPLESLPEPSSRLSPERSLAAHQARELLARGLATLPEEQREAVALRELSGLSYTEIARVCGCSEGTVRSRIARGRERLRTWLRAQGAAPGEEHP